MTTDISIFDRPTEVTDDLRASAREAGWPEGLLERAAELRVPRHMMEWWIKHERETIHHVQQYLGGREQLMFGTMRARHATWNDSEGLADLYANSPEEIGDWEITVERSPNAVAQFRLQEHVSISVLEDRGVILAATADSGRNTVVGGKRTSVHIASAWRVRKEFRGKGLSRLLRHAEGPAVGWFGLFNYYYIRSQNFAALGWIKSFIPDSVNEPQREGDVPGVPVTVLHLSASPRRGDGSGIRLARRSDLRRCLQLINRTHKGCDLFRPYSQEFLEQRLDDPYWGEKPEFWEPVYGWPDYYVLEDNGRIVACGGVWDKGKNVREVWRHKTTGETQTFDCTALLDFGYGEGREDAMAQLIGHFIELTNNLGRSYLVAAVEHLPSLVPHLDDYQPESETRALHWQKYDRDRDNWVTDTSLTRLYTDLAYW
jgi:hypothetical protein